MKMAEIDWAAIDAHARRARMEDASSFKHLVVYLKQSPGDTASRELCLVRALISWMHCNQRPPADMVGTHGDGPVQLMCKLHDGRISHAEAFHIICTQAGLDNKIVNGISKSGSYRPGDVDASKLTASWNIVRIDGRWRLLYPRWIIRTAAPPTADTCDSATEIRDTQTMEKETTSRPKILIPSKLNEFWFLTDPEHFIHKCFPDDISMQLLPPPKRIARHKEFMLLPTLTPSFFRHNLTLVTENRCVLYSDKGVCKVEIKCERIHAKNLELWYELQLQNARDDGLDVVDLNQCVFCSRVKGKYTCEVRCPFEGEYKLAVRGGPVGSDQGSLFCQFKIICRERIKDVGPLPIDAGRVAWGFDRHAQKAGLLRSSVKNPKLSVRITDAAERERATMLTFDIARKATCVDYRAELFASAYKGESHINLQEWVDIERDDVADRLLLAVGAPTSGEYALQIQASRATETREPVGNGEPTSFTPVANFLLTTFKEPVAITEEYADSSDGVSDLDDEIEQLEVRKQRMKTKLMKRKRGN